MTSPLTVEQVQAQAADKGFRVVAVPGTSGYTVTRPPDTEPLTTAPLSLEGIAAWLEER
jgi:hypothetical protein